MTVIDDIEAIFNSSEYTHQQKLNFAKRLRAREFSRISSAYFPHTWSRGVWDVEIAEAPIYDDTKGIVTVKSVTVKRNNNTVLADQDFAFMNPPLLVPDVNGEIIRGGNYFSFDPIRALRQILYDAIVEYLKNGY